MSCWLLQCQKCHIAGFTRQADLDRHQAQCPGRPRREELPGDGDQGEPWEFEDGGESGDADDRVRGGTE